MFAKEKYSNVLMLKYYVMLEQRYLNMTRNFQIESIFIGKCL